METFFNKSSNSFLLLLAASILFGCSENRNYAFQSIPDINQALKEIEAEEKDFFILRYRTFSECEISGTGNEIAIRNNSSSLLIVEKIELNMTTNEKVELVSNRSPKVFKTDSSVVPQGAISESKLREIMPGEWLNFKFSINSCKNINRDSELKLNFHIKLKANERVYENSAVIIKKVQSSPMAWL